MRIILSFCLVALLAACEVTPTGPMVISDRAPVQFAGRAPASYAVRGIDVARFQKHVNWRAAKASGVEFAFIKATEGGDLKDPKFRSHWRKAANAGIARGAYHFYYFCTAPEVQARWFIRNVPRTKGALPPVLDMEWNPFSPTCKRRPDGATVRAEIARFLTIVTAHYGQRPIIYTTPRFYKENGLAALQDVEFWLRSTAKSPAQAYPGQSWRFWQYTATGQLPGTKGDVDINVFNGSAEDWANWRSRRQYQRPTP